jgi:hypothetical protein
MAEETRDHAKDTIAIAAGTMGHDLVAALLAELRSMPDHWARLNKDLQQRIIDELSTKVRAAVEKCATIMMRADFQAVPAKLLFVNRKDGIRAGLSVNGDAICRHALFDAAGGNVLVVIADAARWTERMDEIKAKDDQLELFDPAASYDPSVDQPGYRRDQDPLAPAGKTWADLKKSFGVGEDQPAGEPPAGEEPPQIPEGESLTPEQEAEAAMRLLQDQLSQAGVSISLGALQAATEEQRNEARAWVETYLTDPNACTIERPSWLPNTEPPTE